MNIQNGVPALLMSLIAVGLTGCGEKVDCNSSAVKKDVLEIIQSHLNNDSSYNQMRLAITGDPKLENIKTVDADKDRKQAQCMGTYSFTYNEKPRSFDFTYNLAYLEDKGEIEVRVVMRDILGKMIGLGIVEGPIKNGEEKKVEGNVVAVRQWKKGREDGVQKFYNRETNALVHEYNAVAGKKDGSEKKWTSDGQQLVVDLNWVDGKKNGTEKRIREKDGKLMTDVVWKDDKATGFITFDHATNSDYTTTQFKDGLKNGPQKSYSTHPTEYLYRIENFKDDKLEGLVQNFNSYGELTSESIYSEGVFVRKNETESDRNIKCVDLWVTNYRSKGWQVDNAKRFEFESWCKEGKLPN